MLHAHNQQPEITGLKDADVFKFHPMDELQSLSASTHLLNAICSYHQKCKLNGNISKHKSCICVDGSNQQYGINYWNTYALVVQWSTVQLMPILLTILGLASCQIDYVQAFPQAAPNDPIYMCIPQGWYYDVTTRCLCLHADPAYHDKSYFIELKHNLYGCKQAAHNWYMHLVKGLLAHGFHQSTIDPCHFICSDCIIVLYMDDCCIFGLNDQAIDTLLASLSEEFVLQDEGMIKNYLGSNITKVQNPSTGDIDITFTQTSLINSILSELKVDFD